MEISSSLAGALSAAPAESVAPAEPAAAPPPAEVLSAPAAAEAPAPAPAAVVEASAPAESAPPLINTVLDLSSSAGGSNPLMFRDPPADPGPFLDGGGDCPPGSAPNPLGGGCITPPNLGGDEMAKNLKPIYDKALEIGNGVINFFKDLGARINDVIKSFNDGLYTSNTEVGADAGGKVSVPLAVGGAATGAVVDAANTPIVKETQRLLGNKAIPLPEKQIVDFILWLAGKK